MSTYFGYIPSADGGSDQDHGHQLEQYCQESGLPKLVMVHDDNPVRVNWEKRELRNLMEDQASAGDCIVVASFSDLARSTLQLLEILQFMADRQLSLQVMDKDLAYTPSATISSEGLFELLQQAESEYISHRNSDSLERRRNTGAALGRPKGRKNKSRKLDRHHDDIMRYLRLNISKASIAKLVGCHAQTLYNYIEDYKLVEKAQQREASTETQQRSEHAQQV